MGRVFRSRRRSYREQLEANQRGEERWAAMSGKPARPNSLLAELGPKRKYTKRARGSGPSEHQEQAAVIQWWGSVCGRYGLPHFALFAIPNGGARDVITGARLKAEGVRPGCLDLMLAKPRSTFSGLFIEMKVGDNQPSDNQKAFISYLTAAGYKTAVHWSAADAMEEIAGYLA